MKILSAEQTRAADQYTIQNEPISSLELMERAALKLAEWIESRFEPQTRLGIFCGAGNNGGDGLALARILHHRSFPVQVFLCGNSGSADFEQNLAQIPAEIEVLDAFAFKADEYSFDLVVDAIFGSGLNRPVEGKYRELIEQINRAQALRLAVDLPSGLFADDNRENDLKAVFQAHYTLSFQHPKLSLLVEPSLHYAGQVEILNIGLSPAFYGQCDSDHYFLEFQDLRPLYRKRAKHSYKGKYGHAFHLCGSLDKMGAALISAEAALRSGLGLLTASIPEAGFSAANARLPELMLKAREKFSAQELGLYDVILAGPGMGTGQKESAWLKQSIQEYGGVWILDADALRILAENPTWMAFLPAGSILTPHLGELKALLGRKELGSDYLEASQALARKHQIYILIKNSVSAIVSPNAKVYFADFGSPALAKGGSGDLLAGIITALRAQAYAPLPALCLALFLQGQAAKLAAQSSNDHAVLSSDVIQFLGQAFKALEEA